MFEEIGGLTLLELRVRKLHVQIDRSEALSAQEHAAEAFETAFRVHAHAVGTAAEAAALAARDAAGSAFLETCMKRMRVQLEQEAVHKALDRACPPISFFRP